jgi:cell wall-associated NlpC family hydrolase
MKKFLVIWLLSVALPLLGRGQDDPLKSVYRTLGNLGEKVRNTFIEDSDDRPSPTPRKHRKSTSKHSSSKKSTKHAGSTSDSSDQEADPSDKNSKSKPDSGSSEEKKQDGGRTAGGEEKAKTNPSPIPDQGAGPDSTNKSDTNAPMATIKPESLREFSEQPAEVQNLIRNALALTEQNLGYKYGSADPAAGGMDCSGFIYYELSLAGFKDVPRDSEGQYEWVRKSGGFHAVLSRSGESFELNDLRPGDLLFWSGTYKVDRDIPISHVMIYLGKEKSTNKPVMVGSTDGRSYEGVRRFGVSVFDFKMPSGKPNKSDPELTTKFEGYASIPGLRKVDGVSKNQLNPEPAAKKDEEAPAVKPKPKPTPDLGNGD